MTERLRVAVVGCGGIAVLWTDALAARDDVDLVALVDVSAETAKAFAERNGLTAPIYTDLSAALAAEGVDAICNITPPEAHLDVDLEALAAGCHVFTEKPVTPTVADGLLLAEAARAAGRRVSVMQNRRYDQWARAVASTVAAGGLGTPSMISIDYFMRVEFGGFRAVMDNPLLLDMAIHHFDQVRQLSPVPVVRVSCVETNPDGAPFRGNASAVCTFERADGSLVSYRGSWWTGGMSTPWAAAWRVSGPAGSLTWDGEKTVRVQTADGTSVAVAPALIGRWGHAGCIDAMVDAVLDGGRAAETDIEDNLRSLALVEAAVTSARRREPVEVSLQ